MKFQILPLKRFLKFIHSKKAAKHLVNFPNDMEIFVKLLYHHVFNKDLLRLKQLSTIILKAVQIVHNEAISYMKVVFAGPAKLASPIKIFCIPIIS